MSNSNVTDVPERRVSTPSQFKVLGYDVRVSTNVKSQK